MLKFNNRVIVFLLDKLFIWWYYKGHLYLCKMFRRVSLILWFLVSIPSVVHLGTAQTCALQILILPLQCDSLWHQTCGHHCLSCEMNRKLSLRKQIIGYAVT